MLRIGINHVMVLLVEIVIISKHIIFDLNENLETFFPN